MVVVPDDAALVPIGESITKRPMLRLASSQDARDTLTRIIIFTASQCFRIGHMRSVIADITYPACYAL